MTAHRAPGYPSLVGYSNPRRVAGLPIPKPVVRHAWAPHTDGYDPTCGLCELDAERARVIVQRGIEWSAK